MPADAEQQNSTQSPGSGAPPRRQQSSFSYGGNSAAIPGPAVTVKRGVASVRPRKTTQIPEQSDPCHSPVTNERIKPQKEKLVQRGGNRVVVTAATCIGLAISLAAFVVFQNESRRAQKSSEEIWKQANDQLDAGNVSDASKLLNQYMESWRAKNQTLAEELLDQIELATSDNAVNQKLVSLNDEQFQQCIQTKSFPDNRVTHPILVQTLAASIIRNADAATQQRADMKARKAEEDAAAAARQEQERLARQAAEQAQRDAAKKVAGGASKVRRYLGLNQRERETLAARIVAIETSLDLADLKSRTVFQQQVGRVDACIEMTALLALSLGATPEDVEKISTRQEFADITADNVYQQLAGHLDVYVDMIELAAASAGAPADKCESIRSSLLLEDTLARTVLQQVSSRIGGVSSIAALLAEALGAETEQLALIAARVSTNELSANTVFQQMVTRQSGIVYVLATAAVAQGAPDTTMETVEAGTRQDDLRTETAQQQLAARLERTFQATTLLTRAIVEK